MKLTIDTTREGKELGDLFGIFFEDINHAADGGLYAELVQNRSFEFSPADHEEYNSLTAWEKIGSDENVTLSIETKDPVSSKNPHYLAICVQEAGCGAGVRNLGFNCGIALKAGAGYFFSCYARSTELTGMKISLREKNGETLAEDMISLTSQWKKHELVLTPSETTDSACLELTVCKAGCAELDFVSLFPKDTFKGRKNGMRKELAEKLEALHPKFMRFPGGCLVHDGDLDPDSRTAQYRWKNSIGPLEERPARRNNWNYNQTLGLGYYEYFLLCEDIGAKPLPVLPGGFDPHHQRAAEGRQLEAFAQDALDLIEFANGSADSRWGSLRAELGHPQPFNLEYIGIGNEEVGEEFFERYAFIHRIVKEQYPDIKLIGTSGPFAAGEWYERGWQSAREENADFVDEHYYQSPEWFLTNHERYEKVPADGPKVFLGEYASHGNRWKNALAEASYMIALQNAPAVALACYAPLFANVDYVNWEPDMIWYDNSHVYVTPNYYVQKLFMNHQGDVLLEQTFQDLEKQMIIREQSDCLSGRIALEANDSVVSFSEIRVIDEDHDVCMKFPDQTADRKKRLAELEPVISSENYIIRLCAKELEGRKGFRIQFARHDDENKLFWSLGGWANSDSILGQDIDGSNSCLIQKTREIEAGRSYQLEIRIRGRKVEMYVDGILEQEHEVKPLAYRPVYASSSFDRASSDIIIKLVNLSSRNQTVQLELKGGKNTGWSGCAYIMDGYAPEDGNDFESEKVKPREETVIAESSSFSYELTHQSVHILRLHREM